MPKASATLKKYLKRGRTTKKQRRTKKHRSRSRSRSRSPVRRRYRGKAVVKIIKKCLNCMGRKPRSEAKIAAGKRQWASLSAAQKEARKRVLAAGRAKRMANLARRKG